MRVYTYDYDPTYEPAMPAVNVVIYSHTGEYVGLISALVDSGSDVTTVPVDLLEEIGAISIEDAVMSGIWGDRQPVNLYLVTLEIASYRLPGVLVAGVPDHIGSILGRNVLNHIELKLNGPAGVVEIPSQ